MDCHDVWWVGSMRKNGMGQYLGVDRAVCRDVMNGGCRVVAAGNREGFGIMLLLCGDEDNYFDQD